MPNLPMPPVPSASQFNEARGVMLVDGSGSQYSLAEERRRDMTICFNKTGITSTGYGLLIDLSDTVNYPHDSTGRIDLSSLYISVDKDNPGRGSIAVGVVTRIDNTDADVTYFQGYPFQNDATSVSFRDKKYSPSQLKAGINQSGGTPFIVSNEKELGVAALNLLTPLVDTTAGVNAAPGVGDIIVKFTHGAGAFNLGISSHYHSEESATEP